MSCMIMAPEPLAALANAVVARLGHDYNYWGFEAPDGLYRELADCKTSSGYHAGDVYRRLYEINVRAYDGRYASHDEPAREEPPAADMDKYAVHRPPEYRKHGFSVRAWHYRLAKLLDFWLYQTDEDATRNDPLRLAMAEFRDGLYAFIVMRSPEYDAAPWGGLPKPDRTTFHINTAPGKTAAEKGHAAYPDDFQRLAPGGSFVAWRTEDGWEVETTLGGVALMERLEKFRMEEASADG